MRCAMNKQSGHAAMLFAMMIPALFGVFMLGSDGARALQTKARLEEAAEAAVLAVSAKDEEDNQLAQDYIDHYLYDLESIQSVSVKKLECDEIPECAAAVERGEARYFEYRVAGKTEHKSWFPGNDAVVGFGETFDVTGSSKARRYQSQPVDITFVVDFSGSMNNGWSGGRHSKLEDLMDIIEEVTDELSLYNQLYPEHPHRVAITGYNRRTSNKNDKGKLVFRDQRITDYDPDGYDKDDKFYPQKTINAQFTVKGAAKRIPNEDDLAEFYDIYPTTDLEGFMKKIKKFKAHGGTAFLQGVIRAGQIVKTFAENPKQLIIVLSDGEDSDVYEKQVPKLISRGMCTNILNLVNGGEMTVSGMGTSQGMKTPSGDEMTARLAVIGFDYDLKENVNLKNCVGKDNVYKAENRDDILNQILSLITEEVGHLAQ